MLVRVLTRTRPLLRPFFLLLALERIVVPHDLIEQDGRTCEFGGLLQRFDFADLLILAVWMVTSALDYLCIIL